MAFRMFEGLEARVLLAFNPSGREQETLELINRMRIAPAAELPLLLNSRDRDVRGGLDGFDVNVKTLKRQWAKLEAVPPVAWNESLYRAAVGHTREMIESDEQSHQLPGEKGLRDRTAAAGYPTNSFLGENVFAFAEGAFQAHAAFAIDWGNGPDGIQNPPGHRNTIMSADYREVGVAILNAPKGTRDTGPLLTTQDFGGTVGKGNAFLMGTVRRERDNDGVYDAGEGLGRVRVTIKGENGTFKTSTLGAGAYQLKVPAGKYTVTASGTPVGRSVTKKNVVVGGRNVKTDFVLPVDGVGPTGVAGAKAVRDASGTRYAFKVAYTDNVAVAAGTVGNGDIQVTGPNGFSTVATLLSKTPAKNADVIVATYRIDVPGGVWDRKDNGTYSVRLVRGQVKDINGRAAAAGEVGTFVANIA